ncbi:MAG: DivIVA domain-containing protein [Ruminococcaceae bacterium]|nr:DivIVA domain-containing protein [Oscillospiraceae bacterium]
MLTLNEIRNVNFRKANFGGYRAEDVEAFIDEVQLSYDTLLRENAELVKKLEVLAAKLEEYQSEEDSIRNALMNAQKVGDASLRDAKHKAEIILKDATIKAEKIVSNAQTEIHRERDIVERMQRDIAEFKTKLLRAYKDHLTLINNLPTDEIMRPETKEMADSVQMLDRRASAPGYDRPGQIPASSNMRKPQGLPTFEENFGEESAPVAEAPAEMPAPAADPFEPVAAPEQPVGMDAAAPGDTLPRVETPSRRRPMNAPRGGMGMPMTEKPAQRKGGFTVDIDDSGSASLNSRSPMPAPAPSRREPGAFGEDVAAAAPLGAPADDQAELSTPASLFKRRR